MWDLAAYMGVHPDDIEMTQDADRLEAFFEEGGIIDPTMPPREDPCIDWGWERYQRALEEVRRRLEQAEVDADFLQQQSKRRGVEIANDPGPSSLGWAAKRYQRAERVLIERAVNSAPKPVTRDEHPDWNWTEFDSAFIQTVGVLPLGVYVFAAVVVGWSISPVVGAAVSLIASLIVYLNYRWTPEPP